MFEMRIQASEGDRLTLDEMAGDIVLAAGDGPDILVRVYDGQGENLQVEETADGPHLSARTACEVRVPVAMPVFARQVAGSLWVSGLSELNAEQVRGNLMLDSVGRAALAEVYGSLTVDDTASLRVVGTVYGDGTLKEVQAVDLQNVRGNLQARAVDRMRMSRIGGNLRVGEVRGGLNVDRVGGNALLRGIGDTLILDQVAGNLVAKDLAGGARVGRIGGNLVWNGALAAGRTYHFAVDGNAKLRLAEGVGAHVTLRAGGNLQATAALTGVERNGTTLTGILGDGASEIVVEAKGNIMLGGGPSTVGAELGEEISRQVEESLQAIDLEAIGRHVGEEMEAAMSRLRVKLEDVDWDRIGRQAQQAVAVAMDRMQRDMDRMVDRAAHHQQKVECKVQREARRQERMERKQHKEGHDRMRSGAGREEWPPESTYEAVEPEPELDDERLSILRMVEQGQITPTEAEMLLDALR